MAQLNVMTSAATLLKAASFTNQFRRLLGSAMDSLSNKYFVDGKFVELKSTFPVYNPYNGQLVGNAADCDKSHAEEAVKAATKAFSSWKNTTAKQRHGVLKNWHRLMMENQKYLAEAITAENGKVISEAMGEVAYAASFVEWLAEECRRSYGMTIPTNHNGKRFVTIKQPIGVSAMITPWNFPIAMVTRKAGAAIAAGCPVVLKPSEETPFTSLALAKLASEAGLPPGVLNVLPSSRENSPKVGKFWCEEKEVKAISFTGSTQVGKILLSQSASTVKKVMLELGGHAPFVVFDSADMDKAIQGTIAAKFRYAGQTCICPNRMYVQSGVHDEYVSKLVGEVKEKVKYGDPNDPKTTHCSLIHQRQAEKVKSHVDDAVAKGAKLVCGGKLVGHNCFEPTILTNVTMDMLISCEETFGPVCPIIKFDTEEELLKMVNNSDVGLAGYMFSRDVSQCWRVSEQLEVGMVGINEGAMSTCECPFGGVKESGLGREGSHDGVEEFMETKYLCWGI